MAAKRNISDLKGTYLRWKWIFVRVDLNIPLDDNLKITDETKIRAVIPTINYLREHEAMIILWSHLGRPKGVSLKYSLKVPGISDLLGVDVEMANDSIGEEVEKIVAALPDGGVIVLKNVRFYRKNRRMIQSLQRNLISLLISMLMIPLEVLTELMLQQGGVTKYLKPIVVASSCRRNLTNLSGLLRIRSGHLLPLLVVQSFQQRLGCWSCS